MSTAHEIQMAQVPESDLRQIRRALNDLLANHHRRGADGLRACSNGSTAYRLCFTDAEKARILAHGQQVREEAPPESVLHELAPFETYTDVLRGLGDQAIFEALGEEA